MRDYEHRLGKFRGKPQPRRTVGKGHFGQRRREITLKAMGGERKVHREECTCPARGEWLDADVAPSLDEAFAGSLSWDITDHADPLPQTRRYAENW